MDLTHEDVLRILKVVEESDYEELRLELGDLKLVLRKRGLSQCDQSISALLRSEEQKPIQTRVPVDPPMGQARVIEDATATDDLAQMDGLIPIRSPMLGTFYRSSSPGDLPFVETDQTVEDVKVGGDGPFLGCTSTLIQGQTLPNGWISNLKHGHLRGRGIIPVDCDASLSAIPNPTQKYFCKSLTGQSYVKINRTCYIRMDKNGEPRNFRGGLPA